MEEMCDLRKLKIGRVTMDSKWKRIGGSMWIESWLWKVEEGEGNVDWKNLLEFGGREEEEESGNKFERGKKKKNLERKFERGEDS